MIIQGGSVQADGGVEGEAQVSELRPDPLYITSLSGLCHLQQDRCKANELGETRDRVLVAARRLAVAADRERVATHGQLVGFDVEERVHRTRRETDLSCSLHRVRRVADYEQPARGEFRVLLEEGAEDLVAVGAVDLVDLDGVEEVGQGPRDVFPGELSFGCRRVVARCGNADERVLAELHLADAHGQPDLADLVRVDGFHHLTATELPTSNTTGDDGGVEVAGTRRGGAGEGAVERLHAAGHFQPVGRDVHGLGAEHSLDELDVLLQDLVRADGSHETGQVERRLQVGGQFVAEALHDLTDDAVTEFEDAVRVLAQQVDVEGTEVHGESLSVRVGTYVCLNDVWEISPKPLYYIIFYAKTQLCQMEAISNPCP